MSRASRPRAERLPTSVDESDRDSRDFLCPVDGMSGRILRMDCSRALVMTQMADSADDRSLMAQGWYDRR
jgi:hypothetical protein